MFEDIQKVRDWLVNPSIPEDVAQAMSRICDFAEENYEEDLFTEF